MRKALEAGRGGWKQEAIWGTKLKASTFETEQMHQCPHVVQCAYSFRMWGGRGMERNGSERSGWSQIKGGLHSTLSVALSPKLQGRKEGRAQRLQDPQGSAQLGTCKCNTTARPASSAVATFGCHPSDMLPGPLPCGPPSEMDTESVLPYADLSHQPVLLHY